MAILRLAYTTQLVAVLIAFFVGRMACCGRFLIGLPVSASRHFKALSSDFDTAFDSRKTISRAPGASQTVSLQSHNARIQAGGQVALPTQETKL
jgi:hypothetical protein